jgi:hypothetical protein
LSTITTLGDLSNTIVLCTAKYSASEAKGKRSALQYSLVERNNSHSLSRVFARALCGTILI